MVSGAYNVAVLMGPYPIDGGNFTFEISDADDTACTFLVEFAEPMTCSTQCSISSLVDNVVCDDNGSPSDPSDDLFYFDLVVSGMNLGNSWTANDILNSSGLYGATITLGPYAISDGDLAFTITDEVDISCTTEVMVFTPLTCSDECEITTAIIDDLLCNDNGTPSDPTDDTYSFSLFTDGQNIGSSWTFDAM